ncbi:hypothetical protein DCS_00525 [Drechmeria coniospora]|uniref:Uncharacterized protein n=1 Tax=Drechmeria coniospora TaxID=98403 RepID=A0A151GQK2_DRECN|nr:hypothetical protein DCS_00525 [Drechmeria coniospora]KYK59395.1 hypothetical protein DCS_00525 [Drechmeria coniospora]
MPAVASGQSTLWEILYRNFKRDSIPDTAVNSVEEKKYQLVPSLSIEGKQIGMRQICWEGSVFGIQTDVVDEGLVELADGGERAPVQLGQAVVVEGTTVEAGNGGPVGRRDRARLDDAAQLLENFRLRLFGTAYPSWAAISPFM